MKCEYCGNEHDGTYGSGRFCNHKCQFLWYCKKGALSSAQRLKERTKIKHEKEQNTEYVCEKCGKHYLLKDGISKRFCCRSCANSRGHSEERNKKISETLLKRRKIQKNKNTKNKNTKNKNTKNKNTKNKINFITIRYCKTCGKQISIGNKSGYCSKCNPRLYMKTTEYREHMRQIQLQKVANGTHKGWNSRNITSYAERFWKKVLESNKINFQREVAVKKKDGIHCYFLDFLIDNINLEIDGKQHLYENRKESDAKRDAYLQSLGYIVYRIPWNYINNKKGKELMKSKIEKFLSFLNDHTASISPVQSKGPDL